jgi:VIT1/CCC1 family predicted Fe2+/Mn2+ transporter
MAEKRYVSEGEMRRHKEAHGKESGRLLEDVILGGQDGLVNVLGIVLGVATATNDPKIVIIAGLSATFAESLAMAAVAYTSQKAGQQYYQKEKNRELWEIENDPKAEKQEIMDVYSAKGFKGKDLENIVNVITSNKQVWLDVMMSEELNLGSYEDKDPAKSGVIVGLSAFFGSLVSLWPFFFIGGLPFISDTFSAMMAGLLSSLLILFIAGWLKSQFTVGSKWKNGIEMMVIGGIAGVAGYIIGVLMAALL